MQQCTVQGQQATGRHRNRGNPTRKKIMGYKASLDSKMENTAFMHLKFNSNFVFFKLTYIANKKKEE